MMIVLVGCVVGYATVFVLSQLTKLNDFVCGVQYWFFGIAFVLTFGYGACDFGDNIIILS